MDMETIELQNNLIRRVLEIQDNKILNYLYKLAYSESDEILYVVNAIERRLIGESMEDAEKGKIKTNDEVFQSVASWLDK
jgi:predicted transcriptional regulator